MRRLADATTSPWRLSEYSSEMGQLNRKPPENVANGSDDWCFLDAIDEIPDKCRFAVGVLLSWVDAQFIGSHLPIDGSIDIQ